MKEINFEINVNRLLDCEVKTVLDTVRGYKDRISDYTWWETSSSHPYDAFEFLNLGEPNLDDSHRICMDIGRFLTNEFKSYDKICDVVNTRCGINAFDKEYTDTEYRLRPEYAAIVISSLSSLEEKLIAKEKEISAKKEAVEQELKKIKASIKSAKTEERNITDEGGRTKEYIYTITCLDDEVLRFSQRSLFDFGIVINPLYDVGKEGKKTVAGKNGWDGFDDTTGWYEVRAYTPNEKSAIQYIQKLGAYAGAPIRM